MRDPNTKFRKSSGNCQAAARLLSPFLFCPVMLNISNSIHSHCLHSFTRIVKSFDLLNQMCFRSRQALTLDIDVSGIKE
jgi:hypothetical protein